MALTPIEVQQKTFATALRGYDLDEVDDFLDQVVTSLNDYEQRLSDAKERIAALEAEVANRGDDESAISRALVTAQRSADRLVADAEADAARIVSEAEAEAARVRDQAGVDAARISEEARAQTEALQMEKRAQRSRLEAEIAAMRKGVGSLRERVRALVGDIEGSVGQMEEAIAEASGPVRGPEGQEAAPVPPVPVEEVTGGAETPAHQQLDVGRIDGEAAAPPDSLGQSSTDEAEGGWEAEGGAGYQPATPPDQAPSDPVHRAEEQLVAEMSADIEDLVDEGDDDQPDVVAEAFEGGSFEGDSFEGDGDDDGEFERVRRPWESD